LQSIIFNQTWLTFQGGDLWDVRIGEGSKRTD